MVRRRWSLVLAPLAVVMLTAVACGGPTKANDAPSSTVHVAEPAGSEPSASAKLVCSDEAQGDLASALGVKPVQPVTPTWVGHLYSCQYVYGAGTVALSVKELTNKADTTTYFDALGSQLGNTGPVTGLGQGAFTTTNHSVVVRKDYKVLLVDISGLPGKFGTPPTSPADVAVTFADVIMGCWTGA